MLNLIEYKKDILAIAIKNGVTMDIGRDMFVANVEKGEPIEGQPWYKGAETVDYPALTLEWDEMNSDEKSKANLAFVKSL